MQWAKGPWTITGIGNYVGSYDMTDPSIGVNDCDDRHQLLPNRVSDCRSTSDAGTVLQGRLVLVRELELQYQVNKQLMVQLSGVNIFNQKPPVDMQTVRRRRCST